MIAPGTHRDGAEANALITQIADEVGRVLLLAPSDWRLRNVAGDLLPNDLVKLDAANIESGLEPFTTVERAALLLANRYDGIDLPGRACQLIILSGLPSGTHLQERFLFDVLGARHVLAERIRTRITQGVGRATRARRDTSVVVLHGDDLLGFLSQTEIRRLLRSELQAELELALSTDSLSNAEVLLSVRSFLAQDEDWRPTENWLRSYAQDHGRSDPLGAERLAAAAPHEIGAWEAAWRGDYGAAVSLAQRAAIELNHPTMSAYRAWWMCLAASWCAISDGTQMPRTIELTREAASATKRLRWRPALADATVPQSQDDALAVRAAVALSWLRDRCRSPKLERELTKLETGIQSDEAVGFELGIAALGKLLGFEAERPASEADPDGAWKDGSRLWVVWEAKSEELPTGKISVTEVRQANSHPDWIRHHYAWPEPEKVITALATPKTRVHSNVAGVPAEHLYLVAPSLVRELSARAVAIHRQIAGELVGLTDDQATARMSELFQANQLDTPDLVARLTTEPMRT
jgi:hypothetical protein